MDIYFTIEEKYLKAVDELNYGESPRALQLLNEIIDNDPSYARAHYQLGLIHYYNIEDYQAAGYHFKLCVELDSTYPDVYYHYLKLIVFLNMGNIVNIVAEKAMCVPGVNIAAISDLLGLYSEKNKRWDNAINYYKKALLESTSKKQSETIEESISRIEVKKNQAKKYNYQFSS